MTCAFDERQVTEVPVGTIVRLIFKDTLKKEDYEHFVPMVEKIMAAFIKPFTTATVKYFDIRELDAAIIWISE